MKLAISFISAENFWIQDKSIRNRFRMANIWIISDHPKCFPRLYMKRILYDTVNQATVNRAVHSNERREKGISMNIVDRSTTQ